MAIRMRSYHWNKDFQLVQQFLTGMFDEQTPFQNWLPSKFENMKFGPCGTEYLDEEDEYVKVWEDGSRVVAITIVKPSGECWIQIHPIYREQEDKIINWIEKRIHANHSLPGDEKKPFFLVAKSDRYRENILSEKGYTNRGLCEHNRFRPVDLEIPSYSLPDGYEIRTVKMKDDYEKYRKAIVSVFPHCSKMTRSLADTYIQAQFYHPELDFVVVAPDETFVAFTTVRLDPVGLLAELEPVGVHPNHRKLDLAKAIISEALMRLQTFNPRFIAILGAATTEGAIKLYDGLGFTKEDVQLWVQQ